MGIKQKSFGDLFEDLFFNMCGRIPGMAITRFPDGCRVVGHNKIVRVKTPCDWILTYGGMTALLDTKTTEGNSFPYSKIEPHQIEELLKHQSAGGRSGYIIWFRKSDDVVFVNSLLLSQLMQQRGSIKCMAVFSTYLGKTRDFKAKNIFGMN